MKIFGYNYKATSIHKLNATTKFLLFIFWSMMGMITYNTYILLFMLLLSIIAIYLSKIEYEEVSFVLWIMIAFSLLNTISIYIFSPQEGVKIYGTIHKITNFNSKYDITYEQLFYEFNILLKYMVVAPVALIFVSATNPIELSEGLYKIGIPYSVCYGVSLAFRYIPDLQIEYYNIKKSKEARGIELTKKTNIIDKLKNTISILVPVLFSSLEKIDVVSTAMELRYFGKMKKRTWYSYKSLEKIDYIVLIIFFTIFIISMYITFRNGSRFYNPFIS